jgi:hypothetical protein
MNIFILHKEPSICAKMHCDRHVVKMIIESCQILCSVHWILGKKAPYKLTHYNHPCSIWARSSISNYKWLLELTRNLCNEYSHRYNRKHACEKTLKWCEKHIPKINDYGLTKFVLAMPDK